MQINNFYTSEHSRLEETYKSREPSSSNIDASFFTSMLGHTPPTAAVSRKEGAPTLLAEAAQQLKLTENNLVRLLKSSRKGPDMDTFKEYPRELSKAVLTSQLLVKCLGKTTQCIDKLSNLQ